MDLLVRWNRMWQELEAAPAPGLFEQLIAAYSEPHRKYHTLQHLDECFAQFELLRADAKRAAEIELALWFHDAIYDIRRQDNERKSAEWAREVMTAANIPQTVSDRIWSLVMATRHDGLAAEPDEKILVDVDLSILGAPAERFDEYERQIREEYSWVPSLVFRAKRRKVLERFLAGRSIFNTPPFIARYDEQARANLGRSLKELGGD